MSEHYREVLPRFTPDVNYKKLVGERPWSVLRIFGLLVVIAFMLILLVKVFYDHIFLSIRVSFADDQTEILDEMCANARRSPPTEAIQALEYVVAYYPSGTKQEPGSSLDRIVERARQHAINELIASLRTKTGKDYGDDPQHWIAELSPRQK
jgi:hypothetical protein